MNRVDVTVHGIEPLRNSASGNRVFRLHTDRGSFRTESDSTVAGAVASMRHGVALGLPVTVTLLTDDTKGTVRGIERDGRRLDAAGDPI